MAVPGRPVSSRGGRLEQRYHLFELPSRAARPDLRWVLSGWARLGRSLPEQRIRKASLSDSVLLSARAGNDDEMDRRQRRGHDLDAPQVKVGTKPATRHERGQKLAH